MYEYKPPAPEQSVKSGLRVNSESMEPFQRLIIFGGLGSSSLFSQSTIDAIKKAISSSSVASQLSSKYHKSFLTLLRSLTDSDRLATSLRLEDFGTLDEFLYPPRCYHDHPIIELTTLLLYQLLQYLGYIAQTEQSISEYWETVQECLGLCAGLLPAAVISSSRCADEFLACGTEALHLAFWISYRSLLHVRSDNFDQKNNESCSLVVYSSSQSEVEDALIHLNSKATSTSHSSVRSYSARKLHISTVSNKFISISGPHDALQLLREHIENRWYCRFASVHSWYHGGSQLREVVSEIEADIAKDLPQTRLTLKKPLRSSYDGGMSMLTPGTSKSELVTWIAEHMLVHSVRWSETVTNALRAAETKVRIESFGPGTDSLVDVARQLTFQPMLDILDCSPFKVDISPYDDRGSVAIVGMGFDLPSGNNPEDLWKNLSTGKVTTQKLPPNRFHLERPRPTSTENCGKSESRCFRGSFLEDIWAFDNEFFGVSPREAKSMDPQQRILLTTAQKALENSGYIPDSTPTSQRRSIGCYVGVATGDYEVNRGENLDVYHSTGTLRAFHSGRIAYAYGFGGPCMTLDTACSSSAVAIYQACRSLQNRECSMVIAGGVNLICGPNMFIGLENAHFLSPDGSCKPFDQLADGYGRAEGCTLFILKRLSDAIAENDRIQGVIRDVLVNQSGLAQSITHPSLVSQEALFRDLLKRTQTPPSTVNVVEAHGTGTQAGDVCEITSLYNVFNQQHSTLNPLFISSIKGNLGHCEAASGGAGLVKLLLMLKKKTLLKQAAFQSPNSKIIAKLESGSLSIPSLNQHWKSSGMFPRRCMLNNFGASGSNCAMLIEEPRTIPLEQDSSQAASERSHYTFTVSAPSEDGLLRIMNATLNWLKTQENVNIRDLCYTANARRQHYKYRFATPCKDRLDLIRALSGPAKQNLQRLPATGSLVFIFSGQGALYTGMGRDLLRTSTVFKKIILGCDRVLTKLGCPRIAPYIAGDTNHPLSAAEEVIVSQCSCVALEYGLAKLLIAWDLHPDYVLGHSIGEYSALAIAGVVSIDQIMGLTAIRARAITKNCTSNFTGMAALHTGTSHALQMLAKLGFAPDVHIACRNGEKSCVVSGPCDQLTLVQKACIRERISYKRLDVPYGFHSAAMDPILDELKEASTSIEFRRPEIPVISSATGDLFEHDQAPAKDYFSAHTRGPVLFDSAIDILEKRGAFKNGICLEVGPHPVLLPMIRSSASINTGCLLSTLQRNVPDWSALSMFLSDLEMRGRHVKWREIYNGTHAQLIDCPGQQLKTSTFEAPLRGVSVCTTSNDTVGRSEFETGLVLLPKVNTNNGTWTFTTGMEILEPYIVGHNVGGTAICPASVFLQLSLQACQFVARPSTSQIIVVQQMAFLNPLISDENSCLQSITVSVKKESRQDSMEVLISALNEDGAPGKTYCSCNATVKDDLFLNEQKRKGEIEFKRQRTYLQSMPAHMVNQLTRKSIYDIMFPRVVDYSSEYQSLCQLTASESMEEGIGMFKIRGSNLTPRTKLSILWYDTLMHATGFLANMVVHANEICICVAIESATVHCSDIDFEQTWYLHVNTFDLGDGCLTGHAIAVSEDGEVAAQFQGLKFKRLGLSTFQRSLQGPTQKVSSRSSDMPARSTSAGRGGSRFEPHRQTASPLSSTMDERSSRNNLSEIICGVTGLSGQHIQASTSLKSLGVDSMMEIELVPSLQTAFPESRIDHSLLSTCETLGDLENLLKSTSQPSNSGSVIEGSYQPSEGDCSTVASSIEFSGGKYDIKRATSQNPVVVQSTHSTKTPVVLFHDGSGTIAAYKHIKSLGRDIYAFFNPRLAEGVQEFQSLNDMASDYAMDLLRTELKSVILGGWSFGGVVALEVARQISKSPMRVEGLVLIDSPCPLEHEPLPEPIIRHILGGTGVEPNPLILKQFLSNGRLLMQYVPESMNTNFKVALLHCQDSIDTEALVGVRYKWLCDDGERQNSLQGWRRIFKQQVKVFDIPGDHFGAFNPTNLDATSAQLRAVCENMETA